MVKIKRIQIILVGVLLMCSCSTKRSVDKDTTKIDFCSLRSARIDSVANVLIDGKAQVRAAMHVADDGCLLAVIGNLSKVSSTEGYRALDVIAANSDGYVSEALSDMTVRSFEDNPASLLDYLSSNPGNSLAWYVADGLSLKCNMENLSPADLKTRYLLNLNSESQRKTLDEIFQKVDPENYD